MDEHLILDFPSREEAEDALAIINSIAAAWWAAQGFTVIDENGDKQLVGRNAATGEDVPDACRTTTWANIQESPEGTFYFPSLSNDPRFPDWRGFLPEGVVMPEDKEMPDAWVL